MADADDGEREVLTSLPRSRPVRRSTKRGDRTPTDKAAASDTTAPPRPKAARKAPANGARKVASKPRSPAAAKPTPKTTPKPRARPADEPKRVKPERKVPPAGYAAAANGDDDSSPGATEMLMTALQAATELAQIGVSVGRQALQSAFDRLPKP